MRKYRDIILVWVIGAAACGMITLLLVYIAHQDRGYWAIGGEYSTIPLTILICSWLTGIIRKKRIQDEDIQIRSITKREP